MTLPVIIQSAGLLVSAGILLYAFSRRQGNRVIYFLLLAFFGCAVSMGYWLEVTALSAEAAVAGLKVQYFILPYIVPVYYLFARDYCGEKPLRLRGMTALFLLPACITALAATWPANTLFFRSIGFAAAPMAHAVPVFGPAHTVELAYSLFVAALIVLCLRRSYKANGAVSRRHLVIFTVSALLPTAALLLQFLGVSFGGWRPFSLAFTLHLGVTAWYITKHRQNDWLAYGRETMVENMRDAFILIDCEGGLRDANPAARRLFPGLNALATGESLAHAADVPAPLAQEGLHVHEFTLGEEENAQYFRAYLSPLSYRGELAGTCILIYDNTETHKLMAELQALATQDALTGLLNRGTFFRYANRDFSLARRNKTNGSVLMIDIDNFKQVNDKYGHMRGDEVLAGLSALLLSRLRHTDICGRYGGEELVVWLPGAAAEGAAMIADVIRRAVEGMVFHAEKGDFGVTISIGAATLNHRRHACLEDMVDEADSALYQAKHSGRNCVCVFQPPPEAGEK